MSRRRKILYGFTIALIAILLVLPQTGWLARLQLFPGLNGRGAVPSEFVDPYLTGGPRFPQRVRHIAKNNPSDLELQYAAAIVLGDRRGSLAPLLVCYPSDPRLVASMLFALTGSRTDATSVAIDSIDIDRSPETLLLYPICPEKHTTAPAESSPSGAVGPPPGVGGDATPMVRSASPPRHIPEAQLLAHYVALEQAGERAEPQNSYFPMMLAIGYFAAHKDSEAIAAWKRAAEEPIWDDHHSDESRALEKLSAALNGGSEAGTLLRGTLNYYAAIMMNFGEFRTVAEMAIVQAVRAEQVGNVEEGFAIRRATRRIGERMLFESKWGCGSYLGIRMVETAALRPGGAFSKAVIDALATGKSWSEIERTVDTPEIRNAAYIAYLNRIGHPEEAQAYATATAEGSGLKNFSDRNHDAEYNSFGGPMQRLELYWFVDALLLSGAVYMLAWGGLFWVIGHASPRLQQGLPLQLSARWGIALVTIVPVFVAAIAARAVDLPDWAAMLAWLGLGATVVISPILLKMRVRQIGHGLFVAAMWIGSVASVVGVGALALYFFAGPGAFHNIVSRVSEGFAAIYNTGTTTEWDPISLTVFFFSLVGFPVALLAVLGAISWIVRVPISTGCSRAMRGLAVPIACLLVFGWTISLLATLPLENRGIADSKRMTQVGELSTMVELAERNDTQLTARAEQFKRDRIAYMLRQQSASAARY